MGWSCCGACRLDGARCAQIFLFVYSFLSRARLLVSLTKFSKIKSTNKSMINFRSVISEAWKSRRPPHARAQARAVAPTREPITPGSSLSCSRSTRLRPLAQWLELAQSHCTNKAARGHKWCSDVGTCSAPSAIAWTRHD